jgi:hypothetical protein
LFSNAVADVNIKDSLDVLEWLPLKPAICGTAINLKRTAGIDLALQPVERADASIEGLRPSTFER